MERCPLSWKERGALWLRLGIRVVLITAVILLLVYAGPWLLSLMMPFVLALIVAWLLNPLVRWLQRKLSISRKIISLILLIVIFGVIGGILYGVGWLAVDQVRSLVENWQNVIEELMGMLNSVTDWLNGIGSVLPVNLLVSTGGILSELGQWIQGIDLTEWIASMAGRAPSLVSGVSGFAVAAVVFIMASYFITGDYPRLRFLLTDHVPADTRAFFGMVKKTFMEAFGGYVKSQLLLSLGVFAILAVGFFAIGQSYGLLLAAGLAILDFIPIVGAGTIMVPWAVISLITSDWRKTIELMVIWGVIVLFRRMAEPKILGDQTGLSPIASLVGIYVGMRLGGVLGMICGPLLLLVLINLRKMGVFRPAMDDLRLASRDIMGILRAGRKKDSA